MPWWDCALAQDDKNLHIMRMLEAAFLLDTAHVIVKTVNIKITDIHVCINSYNAMANSADNKLMVFSYFILENRIWHSCKLSP